MAVHLYEIYGESVRNNGELNLSTCIIQNYTCTLYEYCVGTRQHFITSLNVLSHLLNFQTYDLPIASLELCFTRKNINHVVLSILAYYIYINLYHQLGTDHLTCRGGYGFFLKKYSDFGGGKKKISNSEFLSYDLMLNSGKIFRVLRDKKKIF
jgi:hypothetical protein